MISQVYGGGGNAGATYTNDFIELFNPTARDRPDRLDRPVRRDGRHDLAATNLGAVPAGGYYLVQEAWSRRHGPLPTPDATGTILMAAAAGKVALVKPDDDTAGTLRPRGVVDFVGYGTGTNCFEGRPDADNLEHDLRATRQRRLHGHRQQRRGLRGRGADPAQHGLAGQGVPP